jgi:hypothetical protein
MEIDIEEFKERLEIVKAKANHEKEIAEFIHQEIRMTEIMKAGLMEEMNESNKDFLNSAANKFDTYIFQLQEIEKDLKCQNLTLDQKTALNDRAMRDKFEEGMDELYEMDPEKYEDEADKGREDD